EEDIVRVQELLLIIKPAGELKTWLAIALTDPDPNLALRLFRRRKSCVPILLRVALSRRVIANELSRPLRTRRVFRVEFDPSEFSAAGIQRTRKDVSVFGNGPFLGLCKLCEHGIFRAFSGVWLELDETHDFLGRLVIQEIR